MVYRRFSVGIAVRIGLIIVCLYLGIWLFYAQNLWLAPAILGLIVAFLAGEMIF